MLTHKDKFPEDRLVCLAQVFTNTEFLGCRWVTQTDLLVEKPIFCANYCLKWRIGLLWTVFDVVSKIMGTALDGKFLAFCFYQNSVRASGEILPYLDWLPNRSMLFHFSVTRNVCSCHFVASVS
jgi:hypothetical protein